MRFRDSAAPFIGRRKGLTAFAEAKHLADSDEAHVAVITAYPRSLKTNDLTIAYRLRITIYYHRIDIHRPLI
jgi:hypothetical protein